MEDFLWVAIAVPVGLALGGVIVIAVLLYRWYRQGRI
jgi:hypothetical protein